VPADFEPRRILETLVRHGVDFVLVGGLAGNARGSAYITQDVDIAYSRAAENLVRLAEALRELGATLRDAPPDPPFQLDAGALRQGAHFTFATRFGSLDLLDRPDGSPPYDELRAGAGEPLDVAGVPVPIATLEQLIRMKEATGRIKDRLHASEYRVISDELRAPRNLDEESEEE
jgi:hypothetical protein